MAGVLEKIRDWIRPHSTKPAVDGSETLEDLIDDDDLDWLRPPATMSDPAAWDYYWSKHLENGVAGFGDIFCGDGELIDAMVSNGFRTVLCIGCGVSQEPRALAAAGFEVTALDLSPLAIEVIRNNEAPAEVLKRMLEGRPFRPGGSLKFVAGDLCDLSLCSDQVDVIIERCTLQNFSDEERPVALEAVANRLASRGIFFTHCHDGRWKPRQEPYHATKAWFAKNRWPEWTAGTPIEGRVAWFYTTTG